MNTPKEIDRPEIVRDEHLDYLNHLRESGTVNMYGAVPYLVMQYPGLSKSQAKIILGYWMDTFEEKPDGKTR